ncbi:MAG: hypothetical protein K0Q95_1621 [Bacteroidota bacterium]|jgi:hypothetical protein|nr:hypothetical protein [Bacteroidota bacterium]
MKKATLLIACVCSVLATNAQTFTDNFESYTLTTPLLGMQSPNWRTWSSTTGGGTEDVPVVSSDNHTTGGSKSIYFVSTATTGGPDDVILPFGTSPLTTGQFNFTSWFKVPSGKTAYFNFQGTTTMGGMYVLDCWMDNAGNIIIQNSGTTVLASTYPVGSWFELKIDANLNTNTWGLSINGTSAGTWSNANNQVFAIDIFPADNAASFWVDDVSYNVGPYTLPSVNGANNLISVTNGLVGQQRMASVKMRNLGTTTITSFDMTLDQNGGTPVVQNVTGVSIPSLGTYTVNFPAPFTLVAGPNVFTATISNVNNGGADGDGTDNTITTTITPVQAAAGKVVVAEEGTGTWCQWCPRGAVYMDLMTEKYGDYYAGIAVHNSDPMVVTAYDAAMGQLIGGYPSALVDRGLEIDPSQIEEDFLDRIVLAPEGTIVNGATYNSTTRQLKVSITTTMAANITGNYKVACVITEDSVTGTTSAYNQVNAYSGGGSGVMGGFESLPNPVPAAQMNYSHVARALSPSFAGMPYAFGASALVGQTFTHNFSYTLPAAWDASQIHIVGMMIEPSGKINNAGTATISEAVANGWLPGLSVDVNTIASAPDMIRLMPNPANSFTNVSLSLQNDSEVSMEVYSANGQLVASKSYGKMSGAYNLPVDTQEFAKGIYFVKVNVNNQPTILKLIKE